MRNSPHAATRLSIQTSRPMGPRWLERTSNEKPHRFNASSYWQLLCMDMWACIDSSPDSQTDRRASVQWRSSRCLAQLIGDGLHAYDRLDHHA